MSETTTALAPPQMDAGAIEQVLLGGDLSKLRPEQRLAYYRSVCESLGLNPLTKPFDYINLNGKLTLYAKRDCTDQLRKIHRVSILITARENIGDCYVVTARARMGDGREDESTGAVAIANLKGEALANAYMKCETKAKRRVTLSICGLGMSDEGEIENIPNAQPVQVDSSTGEIVAEPLPSSSELSVTIADIEERKDAAGTTLGYIVTFSDGKQARTVDEGLVKQARIYKDNKNPLQPVLERNKRDASKLVLVELGAGDQPF